MQVARTLCPTRRHVTRQLRLPCSQYLIGTPEYGAAIRISCEHIIRNEIGVVDSVNEYYPAINCITKLS